jgi:chromosome segregation ATPase
MIEYLVSLACPNCHHKLRVKHEYLGRLLRCKYCAHEFQSPTPDPESLPDTSGPQETESEQQKSQQRNAVLEAELKAVREELLARGTQQAAAVETLRQTQDELSRLRDQLQQAHASQQGAGELSQKLVAAQSEIEQLRAQIEKLQATGAPKTALGPSSRENAPLLEKAQHIRAQLETRAAIQEQMGRLNAELASARAEQDRLSAELQTMTAEATELRGKGLELERSMAEEKNRSEADRRQLQEQLEALRRTHEQETASLRSDIQRLQQENATLRQDHEASIKQAQVLGEERNQVAAERDELDARYKEAVERFRADFARLTAAWQQSRQQETAAAEQNRALAAQVGGLQAEMAQLRNRETEQQQMIAALQQTVETLHAEAATEREGHNNVLSEERSRAAAERQKWQEEKDASERRFEEEIHALRSEVDHLRGELTVCQQALEIVGVVGE